MQTARVYEPLHKNELGHSQFKTVDSRQRGVDREGEIVSLEEDFWPQLFGMGLAILVFALVLNINWN